MKTFVNFVLPDQALDTTKEHLTDYWNKYNIISNRDTIILRKKKNNGKQVWKDERNRIERQ